MPWEGAARCKGKVVAKSYGCDRALPLGTRGKAPALAALQAFKQALKDETLGILLREPLPSASRAQEKGFDLTSTKVLLTRPPFQTQFVDCLSPP